MQPKKIVFIGTQTEISFYEECNCLVSNFNPFKYLGASSFTCVDTVDALWRNKNPDYMRMLDDFTESHGDADIIVANWINPFHPEWLSITFSNTIKIYGCIDDPPATYQRTINSLWAFDAAFYVSPSYSDNFTMKSLLNMCNIEQTYWYPLSAGSVSDKHLLEVSESLDKRELGLIYVGNLYGNKYDRLVTIKNKLGNNFSIFGRWQFWGYAGLLAPLKSRKLMCYRVKSISEQQKRNYYLHHKIGLNMHFSDKRETGNMRMYEVPYHGMMLLCDKAADNAHEEIFKPDIEAIYYDDVEDAIDKATYYLKHDDKRKRIAMAGFQKYCDLYDSNKCLIDFLHWACNVKLRHSPSLLLTN